MGSGVESEDETAREGNMRVTRAVWAGVLLVAWSGEAKAIEITFGFEARVTFVTNAPPGLPFSLAPDDVFSGAYSFESETPPFPAGLGTSSYVGALRCALLTIDGSELLGIPNPEISSIAIADDGAGADEDSYAVNILDAGPIGSLILPLLNPTTSDAITSTELSGIPPDPADFALTGTVSVILTGGALTGTIFTAEVLSISVDEPLACPEPAAAGGALAACASLALCAYSRRGARRRAPASGSLPSRAERA